MVIACCGVWPFPCHLQASRCWASDNAWLCLIRSEHLRCVSVINHWKEAKMLGHTRLKPKYDRGGENLSTISRMCLRSGRRGAGLLSAWSVLVHNPFLPKTFQNVGRSTSLENEERKKVPWWCGCVLRLFPWGDGGLILFQRVQSALSNRQAGSFPEIVLPWHG